MGNYGAFDRYVAEREPYGYQANLRQRANALGYNTGLQDAATDRDHEEMLVSQARQRDADAAKKERLRSLGMTDYEDELNDRGLLSTDIDYNDPNADPRVVGDAHGTFQGGHNHLKVRGKVDPATAALLKEAAEQGLVGGSNQWVNSAENRTALAALMEGKKADSIREQTRADALASQERELAARAEATKVPERMQAAQIAADAARDTRRADMDRPDREAERHLRDAQSEATILDMKRRGNEYTSPDDQSLESQAQHFASIYASGDPEAGVALRRLKAAHPGIKVDADVYTPSASKVLAQPAIQQKLGEIDSLIKSNTWHLDANERSVVMSKAREAVEAAGEFGPQAQEAVKQHVLTALSGTGSMFETMGASDLRNTINSDWSQP